MRKLLMSLFETEKSKFSNVEEQTLDVNGIKIAFKTWGSEEKLPVLAIHGWLDNSATFSKIAPHLDKNFIVAPDLAGHGQSEHRRSDSSYYLWDYAIDLYTFIHNLGWKNYSILAHSMGTGIASILAAIDDGVKSIVFLDGMGAPFTVKPEDIVKHIKSSQRILRMAEKSGLHGFSDKSKLQFISIEDAIRSRQKVVGGNLSFSSAKLLAERDLIKIDSGHRWRHDPRLTLPEPMQLSDEQAGYFLNNISCPLHILLGKDGLFSNHKFNEKSIYLPNNAKVYWHEGEHHFHLENPNEEMISQICVALN